MNSSETDMVTARRNFLVLVLGVPERELRILKTTFLVSQGRVRSYALAAEPRGNPDIVIVDGESDEALRRRAANGHWSAAPALFLGRGDASCASAVVVPRPLVPTQLLAALDDVTRRFLKFAPELVIGAEAPLDEVSMHSVVPGAQVRVRPRHTALVVDDSLTVRTQLRVLLQNAAVAVDCAEDAEQALHYVAQNRYDIVFLDVVLPGADGYQLCKSIKKNKSARGTTVVMLTGKGSSLDRVRGSFAGCDAYLTKPLDAETFQAVLARYLGRSAEPEDPGGDTRVDDSLTARRATVKVMRDAGFDVRAAIDGLEAVALLERLQPDIILTDMEMPRMNGLELAGHVRARAATRGIPIVMITSRSTEKHRGQAAAAGVNVYLTKPFSDQALLEHVALLTARKEAA